MPGNLYTTDTDKRRILRISPEGRISTQDPDDRLVWGDALWIDSQGFLWIPASQLNLTPGFNHGRMAVSIRSGSQAADPCAACRARSFLNEKTRDARPECRPRRCRGGKGVEGRLRLDLPNKIKYTT